MNNRDYTEVNFVRIQWVLSNGATIRLPDVAPLLAEGEILNGETFITPFDVFVGLGGYVRRERSQKLLCTGNSFVASDTS